MGARRRHALALVAGIGLAGCGGPSEDEQVRSAVTAFGRATASRDYQRLCDRLLAPALVASINRTGLPCEVALEQGLGEVRAPRLAVGRVTVEGDRARAEIRSSAVGETPSRDVMALVRTTDGRWRIASLAGGSGR